MSLNFIPTGTVNYYPYTFNKITSERKILFEGAVPLHEIVYTLYDLFLYYINNTSINIDTYFNDLSTDPILDWHCDLSNKSMFKKGKIANPDKRK